MLAVAIAVVAATGAAYADLRLVTRAPLWDRERLVALWRLWTGARADGLASYVAEDYRAGRRRVVRAAELPASLPAQGTFWCDAPQVVVSGENGVEIAFGGEVSARALQLSLAPLAIYHLTFLRGGQRLERIDVAATAPVGAPPAAEFLFDYLNLLLGLRRYEVELPESARRFDRIEIDCDVVPLLVPAIGGLGLLP